MLSKYQYLEMFRSSDFFYLKYENLFCDTSDSSSLQMLLHVFLFIQGSFYIDTVWCQSIVNTKYLSQTGSVLSTFYILLQKSLYCLFNTFGIVSPNTVRASHFQMQKPCPKFKGDLLRFRSMVRWALQIQHQSLRKYFREMGRERGS